MEPIRLAAERLRLAAETRQPCAPIRDLIAQGDVASAYAVQNFNTNHWLAQGRRLAGRKIGLTAVAVQKQLGVDQPDFGMLFEDMCVGDGAEIPCADLLSPRVEAEISLVLKAPLTKERHSIEDIVAATEYAVASIEVVDSRIANWDITIVDTVADNASSARFVLGSKKVELSKIDLVNCKMQMKRGDEVVSTGRGEACLGNPLNAAVWLADTMVQFGRPLAAGDIVMTGALGPMVAVQPGNSFEVQIEGLGSVTAKFST